MKTMELLAKLGIQYGPFFFAVLMTVGMTRVAYNYYNKARRADQIKTYRLYFIGTASFGMILIIISIIWWLTHQPVDIKYMGVIVLEDYENIASTDVYFKSVSEKLDEDLPPIKKVHFIILRDHPFSEKDKFEISFRKGKGEPREPLILNYVPDEYPNFRVEWDDHIKKNILKCTSQSTNQSSLLLNEAYAQPLIQQPPTGKSVQISTKTTASTASIDSHIVDLLQSERTDVGSKIECLDSLMALPDSALKKIVEFSTQKEPMVLTLLDLSRHTDKELAHKAKRLINERYNINDLISKKLLSGNENERNQAKNILYKMERERAEKILSHIPGGSEMPWLNTLKEDIHSGRKSRVLVPTGSNQGDRYYVEAKWDENKPQVVNCLADLFNKRLESAQKRTLEEELAMMKGKDKRLVYGYSKERALEMAEKIEGCKAKATFKAGY